MNSFTHKAFLWLFSLLPVILYWFWMYYRWRKKVKSRIRSEKLIHKYNPPVQERLQLLRMLLLFTAYIALVLALADPSLYLSGTPEKTKGRDIVVLLDVSKSMLAEDLRPNRLEAGKVLVQKLIRQFPNERFGLMLFAGRPYFSMPLTSDAGSMDLFLETASPQSVPSQGSSLGEAIRMSADAFLPEEKRQQILLLITDGEDHTKEASKAVEQLKEKGIYLIVVGTGTEKGATIPEPGTEELKKDREGKIILSKMNAVFLQALAVQSGGRFIKISDAEDAVQFVGAEIEKLKRTGGLPKNRDQNQRHSFMIFILVAMVLLLIEAWLLSPSKRRATIFFASVFLFFTGMDSVCAQSYAFDQGAYYYQRSDFEKAAQYYQKGLSEKKDSRLHYNLGNCFFRLGKTADALQQYDLALKDSGNHSLQTSCLYNKAVVLHQTGRLKEAVEYYKKALLLRPEDPTIRKNLQLALTQLDARQNRILAPPPENRAPKSVNMEALRKQEKELQKRLQHKKSAPDISEKDW